MIRATNKTTLIISFFTLLSITILFTLVQSCKKLEFERVIRVKTGEVSNTTSSSATITGFIQDVGENGLTQYGHCWATYENPLVNLETKTGLGLRINTGSFDSELTGLTASTTYNIRAYAMYDEIAVYGDNIKFTTEGPAYSTLSTVSPSDITDNSASCGGNVSSDGGTTVTAYGVCWGTTVNPDISDDYYSIDGSGTGSFTSNLTRLSSSTKYYVRAYANNSAGTAYGNEYDFTTLSIISWQRSLGGSSSDAAYCIQQTADGGYIIAGSTMSNNGNVSGNKGLYDCWIIKLTHTGELDWQTLTGGSDVEVAMSVDQTTDGGYIFAGASASQDGDVTGNHGDSDYWLVKLSASGKFEWQKSLGGTGYEKANSVQQTADGGYIIAGHSDSNNGDVSGNHGGEDYWIVKTDTAGDIEWQKSFGGSDNEQAWEIQQTIDKGYIIGGYSYSNDFDASENHGGSDYWIVKIDSAGEIDWQNSLGGLTVDNASCIQQTTDGGYIIGGYSTSNGGDVSDNNGIYDYWIVKLNSSGDLDWENALGGSGSDMATSIQQTSDGGYIVAGYISVSNEGDVSGNHGGMDSWIVKLNAIGDLQWQKAIGGSEDEQAHSIQQTTDGGYVIAGFSNSSDGDAEGTQGGYDIWIVKIPGD